MIRQATGIANRFARARLKKLARERAEGTAGTDGLWDAVEYFPDWRELPPEQQAEVREQIDRLPEDEREVLRRWYYEDKSPQDIAEDLNITEQELRARVERAIGRLGEALSGRQRHGPKKK